MAYLSKLDSKVRVSFCIIPRFDFLNSKSFKLAMSGKNLFSKHWKVVENNFEKLILKSGATD